MTRRSAPKVEVPASRLLQPASPTSSTRGVVGHGSPHIDWITLLPQHHRERVLADSYERIYAAKQIVAPMGEPATTWIGVTTGLLKVSAETAAGQTIMFTAVPQGSWVGEGSVIKREPRKYNLKAMRESTVTHVPRSTFMWLLEESREFSHFIIEHLNERTGQFIAMFEVARTHDPAARVAGALLNLFNPVLNPRAKPMLRISQEELGELVGLSRSTTNQAINALKHLQLITTQYGGILILDVDQLSDFYVSR